ncbi:MAG: 2-isopropylmalate synthase, partial [Planctomycetaceae bacterium]
YTLADEKIDRAFDKFKALADKKKEVFDEDILALLEEEVEKADEIWKLVGVQTIAGSSATPTATVTLSRSGETFTDAAIGDGPVDAVYEAIGRITGFKLQLRDYSLRAITSGKDAQGEVTLEVEYEGKPFRARGVSTDIVEASARAYLAAVNRVANGSVKTAEKPPQP